MLTKILIIVGGSIAMVVAMVILGKMADGKEESCHSEHSERNT